MWCDQKRFSGPKCFSEDSQSFDLIEGHWECEKHAVVLDCLCKPLLKEEGATHLQNGETRNQNGF